MKKTNWLPWVVLFSVVLIWGISPLFNKLLVDVYSPALLSGLRGLLSAVVLLLVSVKKWKRIDRSYILLATLTGLFYGAGCIFQYTGLRFTTPAKSAFLENVSLISTPVFLFLYTRKKPTVWTIVAALICFVGVGVIALESGVSSDSFRFGKGDLLVVIAGVFYGANIATTGVYAKKLDSVLLVGLQQAVIAVISFSYSFAFEDVKFSFAPTDLCMLVAISLISTALCQVLRVYALRKIDASIVSVVMPFSALTTGVLSVVCGTDDLTWNLVLGGGLIVTAIFLSQKGGSSQKEENKARSKKMIKVLQFGEGNFLRTFVDAYFDTLNEEGASYGVYVTKPIVFGSLERFEKQKNRYHIVLRGYENGEAVEKVREIGVLKDAIDPFVTPEKLYSLAKDEELKLIVSNTTEAGICFNADDCFDGFEKITYPAKLTKLLYERFRAGQGGVYLLPVELIDHNADELKACVEKYIEFWSLPEAFRSWNEKENYYCNTLVDRIVSGYPRDEETKARLETLVGEKDELISVGEPFGLWAVEKKGEIEKYIKEGVHNIEVVLTENIDYYKKRKVRVLNGSHTNLVPAGLILGKQTVYDCMTDEKLAAFVENTLREEIIPFVSDDIAATTAFAESVKDRFMNPFLNHQLTSIALNSISKWRARDLPSFKDYHARFGKLPEKLTIGFSYLMALYSRIEKNGEAYTAKVEGRTIEIKDDLPYLEYFAAHGSVAGFMANADVWGEDLTAYDGFAATVEKNVERINAGEKLL